MSELKRITFSRYFLISCALIAALLFVPTLVLHVHALAVFALDFNFNWPDYFLYGPCFAWIVLFAIALVRYRAKALWMFVVIPLTASVIVWVSLFSPFVRKEVNFAFNNTRGVLQGRAEEAEKVALERSKIAATQRRVERSGDALLFHIQDGKTVTLRDEYKCGNRNEMVDYAHCNFYRFIDYFPDRNGFLVKMGQYESVIYKWINERDGAVYQLCDQPHFSPNGGRFALVGMANENNGCNNDVEIWTWSPTALAKDFEYQHPDANMCCDLKQWDDEDHLVLSGGIQGESQVVSGLVFFDHADGAWRARRSLDGGKSYLEGSDVAKPDKH